MRSYNKKYEVDELFFDNIDSNEKAYFLGLMYADGTVSERSMVITLQEGDRKIIDKFKDSIKYTGEVRHLNKKNIKWKNHIVLCIYSRKLVKSLTNLGCKRKKTYDLHLPKLEFKYYSHFLRGLFDGDGCIANYKKIDYFSITGNIKFLHEVLEILCQGSNVKPCKISRKNKDNNVFGSIQYSKNSDLINIRNFIYKDCNDLYMDRKYDKFFKIQKKEVKVCKICGSKHEAKGLCKKHYMYYYSYRNKDRIIGTEINTKKEVEFINIRDAEKNLKINYHSIWANLHGRTKRCHNYIFRYEARNLSIFK